MSTAQTTGRTKRCIRCGEIKPLTAEHFIPRRASTKKWYGHCRDCDNARKRELRTPAADRARYVRQRFKRHPETLAQVEILLRDPCAYCGSREKVEVDHITAVAEGGADDWTNLTACCRNCNSSKNNRPLLLTLARMNGHWQMVPPRARVRIVGVDRLD